MYVVKVLLGRLDYWWKKACENCFLIRNAMNNEHYIYNYVCTYVRIVGRPSTKPSMYTCVVLHLCKGRFVLACVRVCEWVWPLNYKSRLPPIFSMIVLVYSRPLTSKLAETLSCLNRDLTACPSRSNTSQEFPLPWPKGLIDFWLVVLFKPLYSMTSSFEWQLIRLHNSMGICLDTGNLQS